MDPNPAPSLSLKAPPCANDHPGVHPLFADKGVSWIPMPECLEHAGHAALLTWLAVYRDAKGRTSWPHSSSRLTKLMGRGRRMCQEGLLCLEHAGLIERRGSGRFLELVIRARLSREASRTEGGGC